MTATGNPGPGMVLPQFDPAMPPGLARAVSWADVRVPAPFDQDLPARPLSCHTRPSQCPDGRHLFDAIETTTPETGDQQTGKFTQAFRLVLTCIRCGLVEPREGTQDTTRPQATAVDPVPLRAGRLRAQQVSCPTSWSRYTDSFLVHDRDDVVVGAIHQAHGRRGRAYYTARLHAWPTRHHVQAATPAGCLRKLAHAHAPTTDTPAPAPAGEQGPTGQEPRR